MQSLAAAAIFLLVGVSTWVAVRLLLLHRRTGAWPEFLLGGMLLLSVSVGYPLHIAAYRVGPEWSGLFQTGAILAVPVGFSLLFVFTWRVFRPQAIWARVLTAVGVITLLGKALHGCLQVHDRGVIDMLDLPPVEILLQTGPALVAYFWTACESIRYYAVMRRRARLGLADAVVTNRFLVWGVMGLCATGGVALNTGAVLLHVDPFTSAPLLLWSALLGLAEAVFLTLTFVPPRSYLARVRARAVASEG
jgi:hypothetical protein